MSKRKKHIRILIILFLVLGLAGAILQHKQSTNTDELEIAESPQETFAYRYPDVQELHGLLGDYLYVKMKLNLGNEVYGTCEFYYLNDNNPNAIEKKLIEDHKRMKEEKENLILDVLTNEDYFSSLFRGTYLKDSFIGKYVDTDKQEYDFALYPLDVTVDIPTKTTNNEPIDPIRAIYSMEGCYNTACYTTKRFQVFSYLDTDYNALYQTQDVYSPIDVPTILPDADCDFIFNVSWTESVNGQSKDIYLLVAKEDGLWKIDNILFVGNTYAHRGNGVGPKYEKLFNYSLPLDSIYCFEPSAYTITESMIDSLRSIPELVPNIPTVSFSINSQSQIEQYDKNETEKKVRVSEKSEDPVMESIPMNEEIIYDDSNDVDDTDKVFQVVEVMPEYPGGTSALMHYLRQNVKYPIQCQEQGIQGRVIVQFIINKDGSISDPEVIKTVDPLLDSEALRVVSSMSNWKPGQIRGKTVRVKFTIPVSFKLSN